MTRNYKISADVLHKVKLAIEKIKTETQKQEGTVIGAGQWCAENNVSNNFITAMVMIGHLHRVKESSSNKYRYSWMSGYADVTDKLVTRVVDKIKDLNSPGKNAVLRTHRVDTPKRNLELKEGYFTSQHFKVLKYLFFEKPMAFRLDGNTLVRHVRKITFEVEQPKLHIGAFVDPFRGENASDAELINLMTHTLTNKALMFQIDEAKQTVVVESHDYY